MEVVNVRVKIQSRFTSLIVSHKQTFDLFETHFCYYTFNWLLNFFLVTMSSYRLLINDQLQKIFNRLLKYLDVMVNDYLRIHNKVWIYGIWNMMYSSHLHTYFQIFFISINISKSSIVCCFEDEKVLMT